MRTLPTYTKVQLEELSLDELNILNADLDIKLGTETIEYFDCDTIEYGIDCVIQKLILWLVQL